MHKNQYMDEPLGDAFRDCERAWLWACMVQREIWDGAKPSGAGKFRHFSHDDIFAVFIRRQRDMGKAQRSVLVEFGLLEQCAPDPRVSPIELHLWNTALDLMCTDLIAKGIVEKPVDKTPHVVVAA